MNAYIANCRPENWEPCNKETIFGLKEGIGLPSLTKGDLILFRISGPNYGVKAIWYFESAERVTNQNQVPWSDASYDWILKCKKIVTFKNRFSEDFQTSSKKSSKIREFFAGGIVKSIIAIKKPQLRDYIYNIVNDYSSELNNNFVYLDEEVNTNTFFKKILVQLESFSPPSEKSSDKLIEEIVEQQEDLDDEERELPIPKPKQPLYGIVGERVDLPILNYAPLNEKGVILLFGYYLQDLGISHVEEIKAGFPDAIAMRPVGNGKYQRVRIEFEFKSSSFVKHGHDINECDLIVCWLHDWRDCPIEVIELSTALFEKENNL